MRRFGCWIATLSFVPVAALAASPNALQLQGKGSQIYVCKQTRPGMFHWTLKGPDARLYDAQGLVVGRHYAGPHWQAKDGSTLKGTVIDADPAPDDPRHNAAWLLLQATVQKGGGLFAHVNYVTRTRTQGGAAPRTACDGARLGRTQAVPYTATYTFFSASRTSM